MNTENEIKSFIRHRAYAVDSPPVEQVERLIYLARGEKVLLDADLATLYGVSTGALNRAVRRNANRFPPDFMFQLTAEEADNLKCQFGTSSSGHGGRRRSLPNAFTEQGVAFSDRPCLIRCQASSSRGG
jgi:hypothetical protein